MSLFDKLENAMKTAKERDATYGDSRIGFRNNGKVLAAAFPNGLHLKTEDDFCRIVLLAVISIKYTRYTANFERGGHKDSIHDLGVYSLILEDFEDMLKEPKP